MSTRLHRLRALLDERGLDAVIITDQWNRRYLTGYTGHDHAPNESGGIALIGTSLAHLVLSTNNTDWAAAEAPAFEVSGWTPPWTTGIAKTIEDQGWKRVGIEDQSITFANYHELQTELCGAVELVPLGTAIDTLRTVKDADELRRLERALAITSDVMTETVAQLRPGMTEREIAWRIDAAYRPAGAEGVGFATNVASGPNAARPHHNPGDRQIQEGEPIIIDMGALVDGYTGDLTRTVWLGEPDDQLRAVYSVVADAHAATMAGLRAGLTGKEGDALARDVIEAAGYGNHFPHGLGHGLGLRVHEAPSMARTATNTLLAGSVITVEPGIYIPGWGGVRIEDVIELQEDGVRVLTHAPKMTP